MKLNERELLIYAHTLAIAYAAKDGTPDRDFPFPIGSLMLFIKGLSEKCSDHNSLARELLQTGIQILDGFDPVGDAEPG